MAVFLFFGKMKDRKYIVSGGSEMASSIQFMRGLQAKVNAANIKDGQPALVRRSGKTPLLFVGNGSGVGKAVQLAPDIDMYGNLGVTSPEWLL